MTAISDKKKIERGAYRPSFDRQLKPLIDEFKASKTLEQQQQAFEEALNKKQSTEEVKTNLENKGKEIVYKEENGKKSWSENHEKETAEFEYRGHANVTNYEEALTFSKVDLKVWEVSSHTFNTWTTPMAGELIWNIQVKLNFRKRSDKTTFAEFKNDLLQDVKEYHVPGVVRRLSYQPTDKANLALLNIYDTHLDKLAWVEETNDSYNHNIAEERFLEATNLLLNQLAVYKPDRLIFPIGNDFYHTNSDSNTTKRGTPQDVSTRDKRAFRLGLQAVRKAIDQCLYYYPTVEIPIIYGNHDPDKTFYLGEVLSALYENDKRVIINNQPVPRKYYVHGKNLLAFAHGDKMKKKLDQVPAIMAEEASQYWHQTKHRIWYFGDLHHRQTFKFQSVKDKIGVEVQFLRSIAGTDKWHFDSGYIGVPKTAHASVFHSENGPLVMDMRQHFV